MSEAAPSALQPTSAAPVVALSDVRFRWRNDAPWVVRLDALSVRAGERVFICGPSGSGKTTLLGLVGGVLLATSGSVQIQGADLATLSAAKRDRLRADSVGFVFQMFNLIPYLSVLENVLLPCRFSRPRRARAEADGGIVAEAQRLLGRLGLDAEVWSRDVGALSVGQQQRVAVARALIGRPALVIADEPTSALDVDARDAFLALLSEECAAANAALLFVSHDLQLASGFDRKLDMRTLNGTDTGGRH